MKVIKAAIAIFMAALPATVFGSDKSGDQISAIRLGFGYETPDSSNVLGKPLQRYRDKKILRLEHFPIAASSRQVLPKS
jgi:hypothetical protein